MPEQLIKIPRVTFFVHGLVEFTKCLIEGKKRIFSEVFLHFYSNRAKLYYQQGKLEKAIADYRLAANLY